MKSLDTAPTPLTEDPRFTGAVSAARLAPLADPTLNAYLVSFAVGARTAWHAHAHGQLLVCISGAGQVGNREGQLIELVPGSAVWTDPGEEHWHGGTQTQPMAHLAVQTAVPGGDGATWTAPNSTDPNGQP